MPAVFITTQMLTAWSDEGKVRLDDTTLFLLKEDRTVLLKPAVRFTHLIDPGDDPHKLVGKVKSKQQLIELKAEHYLDSVILGEIGYTVVEGFLGDLSPARPRTEPLGLDAMPRRSTAKVAASVAEPPPPAPAATTTAELQQDAEALSRLFLSTVPE